MKRQITPALAIAAIVGLLAVIGIVVYILNDRPAPPSQPTVPSAQASGTQDPAAQTPAKNMSPDDIVKQHMNQMPKGGGQ